MSTRLVWTEHSPDDLRNIDAQTRNRIVTAVERLAATGHGDVRRLEGAIREWRLRVGDWRVRFSHEPDQSTLTVLRVLPRGRAYRR